ncbi:PTS transporter subunit IIC [Mycoplasmopsis synoviae]|uniref:PTS transporter subunit IIC n=1 Tax=Mycoplasmopsis synoviae TaxID=2109 RepID=UPI00296237C4|nr:PTS transporter subunit IIC [Mycoplasmopsis synoviae]
MYKYAFNNAYRTRYVSAICCGSGGLFFNFLSKNVAINIDQIIAIILISSLILGLYWSVGTIATIKGADKITNNAGFAVGHQQMLGLSIAYGLGNFLEMPKIQLKLKK